LTSLLFSSPSDSWEENNREVEDDPPDYSSPEGRVKSEGASRGYEFSREESNLGHSLLKCPMAPQWKHPCLSPFLGDGLRDCALYLSIRFLFTSSIMAAIKHRGGYW
jgi:hypothetical protein